MDARSTVHELSKRFREAAEQDLNQAIADQIDPHREYFRLVNSLRLSRDLDIDGDGSENSSPHSALASAVGGRVSG